MATADVDLSDNPLGPRVAALSDQAFIDRARTELELIYGGERSEAILRRLLQQLSHYRQQIATPPRALWSQATQILICYGDSLIDGDGHRTPLQALDNFLDEQMRGTFSAVHILPFFPWSSDDGFSVVHFREVNPDLGDWGDIHRISQHHNLMADLVINHVSRESLWFTDFLAGTQPGRDYFIELAPGTDVSMVTRPRNTPLLIPVYTRRGKRYVWATFSDDQIDLNYANPDVLLEMLGVLLHYLAQGVRLVRLDAIAFLWKELGTRCIHLPQTHAVVRLIRAIIDHVAPGALLITETNVPHLENLSYFGDRSGGDGAEAHMVYQFTLPPLLVHTLTSGDAAALTEWASTLPTLADDCTYFNFTASHDGIGVRALEGLLPDHEIKQLLDLMQRFGGYISMKTDSDGRDSPYEINITYFDAMKGTRKGEDPWQILRFLCSQTIMMGLQGIPGVYFHSLTGTTNDHENVSRSGKLRAINRKRWRGEELDHLIKAMTPTRFVFKAMTQLLNKRRREPCFHPNVAQRVIDLGPGIFAFLRGPMPDGRRLLAIHSVTDQPIELHLPQAYMADRWEDLLGNFDPLVERPLLKPYYSAWLVSRPG